MSNYWLFKTEPDEFSIDDLKKIGDTGEIWDGIRNYQARNFLRDQVAVGDLVFIYHSSCKNVGVAGVAEVIETNVVDPTQFHGESKYFDGKSTLESPRWITVKVKYVEHVVPLVSLSAIKANPLLSDMSLVKRSRLSIHPVEPEHWQVIRTM